jgi:hypothetical protein
VSRDGTQDIQVGARVVVRINFANHAGTVTRLLPRGRVVVVTDSGDSREWDRRGLQRLAPGGDQ